MTGTRNDHGSPFRVGFPDRVRAPSGQGSRGRDPRPVAMPTRDAISGMDRMLARQLCNTVVTPSAVDEVATAIADPVRPDIPVMLREQPLAAGEIADRFRSAGPPSAGTCGGSARAVRSATRSTLTGSAQRHLPHLVPRQRRPATDRAVPPPGRHPASLAHGVPRCADCLAVPIASLSQPAHGASTRRPATLQLNGQPEARARSEAGVTALTSVH